MRIYATGCTHGHTPRITISEDAEMVILTGDMHGNDPGFMWWWNTFQGPFRDWVEELGDFDIPVVATLGNHDPGPSDLSSVFVSMPKNFHLLIDEEITLCGLRIYGTPWTPWFGSFPWMASENELRNKFARIPTGLDILITHGPPYGVVDKAMHYNEHLGVFEESVGSTALYEAVHQYEPQVLVCSHLHSNGGKKEYLGRTACYNVSYVDENRTPTLPPVLIEEFF